MTPLRESHAERFDRIRHTIIDGHSISNADAKWLCAQLIMSSDANQQLQKRLKDALAMGGYGTVEGGPVGADPL